MEIWHGEKRKKRIQQIRVNECPKGCRCNINSNRTALTAYYRLNFKKRIQQIRVNECPKGCRCDLLNEIIWDYLYPDKLIHPR